MANALGQTEPTAGLDPILADSPHTWIRIRTPPKTCTLGGLAHHPDQWRRCRAVWPLSNQTLAQWKY